MTTRDRVAELGIRLGGAKDVARELGVNVTNVTTWTDRRATNGCPVAVAEAAMGKIYDLNEWKAWHGEHYGAGR